MAGSDPWDDDFEPILQDDRESGSGLDAFDEDVPNVAGDEGNWPMEASSNTVHDFDESPMALFTVTNPPGTVSATAMIGGRLQQIEIHDVSSFNEAQLADEIITLVELAKEKAQAAQHAVTVELMSRLGHDRVGTSGYLQHSIELPSPEVVTARTAAVFAARYPLRTE